ncbi:BtrH N-terminal domain-containing protein [Brassicibacter mesophilus]|uniref:BtrH N-terminal domain-containing protein n=1 Tax=Brassicibacter mesophilus TaxID=745119 RepID=UPI003D190A40
MKKLRTIFIIILAIGLLVPCMAFARAKHDPIMEQIEQKIRSEYVNDPMFQEEMEQYGVEHAEEYIQRMIDREYLKTTQISPMSIPNARIVLSMDVINQVNNTYCGPASTLQTFTSIDNLYDEVAGDTDWDKLETLAGEMGTNSDGTIVYRVKNVLNDYVPRSNYAYDEYSEEKEEDFCEEVYNSLDAGYPAIIHAKTEYLNYYNGHVAGHYISVYGIDLERGKVYLADSHPKSTYRGKHVVTIREAYNSISAKSGRYLIVWR